MAAHREEIEAALDEAEEVEFEVAKPLKITTSPRTSPDVPVVIPRASTAANRVAASTPDDEGRRKD